jgi:hypothetical protein
MLALKTLKTTLKPHENAKQHNIYACQRPDAAGSGHTLTRAQLRSGTACLRPDASRTRSSPHEGTRQPSLLLAEPSPEHTSFLQQYHFQGNIQQNIISILKISRLLVEFFLREIILYFFCILWFKYENNSYIY